MITVKRLLDLHGAELQLSLTSGEKGVTRKISVPEAQRPGLSLSGYLKGTGLKRILVFGKAEIGYIRSLDPVTRRERCLGVISPQVPAMIVARGYRPPKELIDVSKEYRIPLLRTEMRTMAFFNKLTLLLGELFALKMSIHATLVEAFGVGVLIQGDSSIGKSEAALGLIERGHRLISDDVVKLSRKEGGYLEGTGTELNRHLLEIRGIGIVNVAHLFGAVCTNEARRIDMIIRLEEWDDSHFYDRVGLEEKYTDLLGVKVPSYVLPVKPGRDIVLLIETTVLNHRLKGMGYHSAKEFNVKLLEEIAKRRGRNNVR